MNIELAEVEFNKRWGSLLEQLTEMVGKKPDMNAILFLIGVQELGKGKKNFTKEQKQDLMHIATCKLLGMAGYFEEDGLDEDGWPHFKQSQPMPFLSLHEQEHFLKMQILDYFEDLL